MFKYNTVCNYLSSSFTELHHTLFHMWSSVQNLIYNIIDFRRIRRCKNEVDRVFIEICNSQFWRSFGVKRELNYNYCRIKEI